MTAPAVPPDLWYHYGKDPAARTLGRIHWDWYQRTGPGGELLGDLTGLTVAELGSGAGHQAACIAKAFNPALLVGLDSSPAQHTNSQTLYGHVPGLEFVHADAAAFLSDHPRTLDVAYSIFGALDFSDPRILLPAVACALRPAGRLVFSTLGHYKNGAPPAADCRPAAIPTRLSDGSPGTLQRWVLDTAVWTRLLDRAGFDIERSDTLRDPGVDGEPPMDTFVFIARKRDRRSGGAVS